MAESQLLPAGPGHPAVDVANVYPAGSRQGASTSALIGQLRGTVARQVSLGTTSHSTGWPARFSGISAAHQVLHLPS